MPPLVDLVLGEQLYFELISDDTVYINEMVSSVDKEGKVRALFK